MALTINGNKYINPSLFTIDKVSYFKLHNPKDIDDKILFEYVPVLDTEYSSDNFKIYIFENNYLNAENDIFQLIDKNSDIRIGWAFPITILESNDNDFSENAHLNKYKYVAFKILLESKYLEFQINDIDISKIRLSDIYSENAIVIIQSNEQIKNISNYKFNNYLPSFASYGYFLKNKHKLIASFEVNKKFALERRKVKKLKLKNSTFNLDDLIFLKLLYTRYLKSLNHHLLRFHLLYQVIEHFISEYFNSEFDHLVNDYSQGDLLKNDFFEKISNLKSERKSINKIFEILNINKTSKIFGIVTDLARDCDALFLNRNKKSSNQIGDQIYDVRNLVVHEYRKLTDGDLNLLENITFGIELIVNHLITNYK